MKPYFSDDVLTIHQGFAQDVLPTLPDESVNCVVTSPPYWGLRKYPIAESVWGGRGDCIKHEWDNELTAKQTGGGWALGHDRKKDFDIGERSQGRFCRHCNAWRGHLGLEPTPELYVEHLVGIFREVRRVLRSDGVLWLNLGDSYCSTAPGSMGDKLRNDGSFTGVRKETAEARRKYRPATPPGLKPKDLVGVPWQVAFALRADGWWLRSEIIWHKPNPLPEGVRDRPTKAHEQIFMLAKSERYSWDADAVREPHVRTWDSRNGGSFAHPDPIEKYVSAKRRTGDYPLPNPNGRNIRTVWTVPTSPTPDAHFAKFPPKLIEPCIKAGCPEGGVVLDPFAGTGVVGAVAEKFGCRAVLIEPSAEYCEMIGRRTAQRSLMAT